MQQTIDSALAQQFEGSYEILIVDDCSGDNSYEIAKKSQEANSDKIRLIKNTENLGLIGNWNYCVKHAKGEWIKFLFHDDTITPDCIQLMYDRVKIDNSKFVICDRNFLIEENTHVELKDYYLNHAFKLGSVYNEDRFVSSGDELIKSKLRLYNFLGEPVCFLYQKSLVKEFGEFNGNLSQLCDYEYALRIVSNTGFSYINRDLVTFRVSSSTATSKNHSNKKDLLQLVEPLLLLHLFTWNKYYKNYRSLIGKQFLFGLFKKQINELSRLGFKKVNALLKPYFSEFPFLQLHKWYFFKNRLNYYLRKKPEVKA